MPIKCKGFLFMKNLGALNLVFNCKIYQKLDCTKTQTFGFTEKICERNDDDSDNEEFFTA